jgi:hypothetical protein
MSEIDLYVHSAKEVEPRLIRVEDDLLMGELAAKAINEGIHGASSEEIFIFLENEPEPLSKEASAKNCGVGHRSHIHCHKCHRIQVGVNYNGIEKTHAFPPSVMVRRVLKWSIETFNLKGADAEHKILRLASPPNTELSNDAHIGSYVQAPVCSVSLCLVPPVRFEG